jgi:hypothetical protein
VIRSTGRAANRSRLEPAVGRSGRSMRNL